MFNTQLDNPRELRLVALDRAVEIHKDSGKWNAGDDVLDDARKFEKFLIGEESEGD